MEKNETHLLDNTKGSMTASLEDYLEAIYFRGGGGVVRVTDIAEGLGISKPSVHRAIHTLQDKGLVEHEHYGGLALTEKGLEIANRIYERHKVLTQMLIFLGVDPKTAREDACKMEHDISDETFEAMKRHQAQSLEKT